MKIYINIIFDKENVDEFIKSSHLEFLFRKLGLLIKEDIKIGLVGEIKK